MEMIQHRDADWVASLHCQRQRSTKSWGVALLLSILFGFIGADRFYAGRIGLGVLKLITVGGFFLWWLIDIVLLLQARMRDDLGRRIQKT